MVDGREQKKSLLQPDSQASIQQVVELFSGFGGSESSGGTVPDKHGRRMKSSAPVSRANITLFAPNEN
jgi:hypothetical protein